VRDWRLTEDPWVTLGRYNAEVARGIVHTEEWRVQMADLQRQFDEEQHANLIEQGMTDRGDGIWMTTTRRRSWRERFRDGRWWQSWTM
jgi:hypothetical protein